MLSRSEGSGCERGRGKLSHFRRCKVSSEIWFSRFVTMMPCSPTIVTECKPGFEAQAPSGRKARSFERGGLRGVKNINWQRRIWFEGLKNQLQSSRTLRCVHLVRHDARQSSAGNSSDDGGLRRVHTQPRPNRHKAFPLTCSEFPGVRRRERIDRYAIVIANFLGEHDEHRHDQRWRRDLLQGLGERTAHRVQPRMAAVGGRLGRAAAVLPRQGLSRDRP